MKMITTANHNKIKYYKEPIRNRIELPQARENVTTVAKVFQFCILLVKIPTQAFYKNHTVK